MSSGTIVYHTEDFKDCIFIEYSITKKTEVTEIIFYLKNNNVENNYIIGFNSTENYHSNDIKQELYCNGVVTNHTPYLIYHQAISQSIIILIDGTHDMKITDKLCITKILLNSDKHTDNLSSTNIWIHRKDKNGSLINLPNVSKLNPPIVGAGIKDAYPTFGESNWWTNINEAKVDMGATYVIPENIKWTHKSEFNRANSAKNKVLTNNSKVDLEYIKQLEHNLKNVSLVADPEQIGYWLTLNNSGPQTRLYLTSNAQLYSFIIPEYKTLFKHFIDCYDPVQIHLNDFDGPLLVENTNALLEVEYYDTSKDGVLVNCFNHLDNPATFQINIYINNVHMSTRNIIVQTKSDCSVTLDLTLYNPLKKQDKIMIKTSLVRNNKLHLIRQYFVIYSGA